MNTLFVRFSDQATFDALMPADAQPVGETYDSLPEGVTALSVIGEVTDANGVPVPGFHVNVMGTLPDAWKPYEIFPSSPYRIFGS